MLHLVPSFPILFMPAHRKVDDDLSCLHTLAMLTSMDDIICTLKKSRQMKDPTLAMRAYFQICLLGLDTHTEIGNHLVPMFAICGCLLEGQKVFNRLMVQNEHSWTSLIQGSIECRNWQNAIELFKKMEHSSVHPSSFTYVALLKGCAIERLTESGRELHAEVTKQGHDTDSFVGNVLVDMYSKCGSLEEAQKVFDVLPVHDVVSWNSLIAGYIDQGRSEEALSCYDTIQEKGLPCDDLTFVFALKASSNIGALDRGQEIHAEMARDSYECYPNLGSTLIDMYAKCGLLLEAREVFDNIRDRDAISWNPLMTAYVDHGLGVETLECLEDMKLEGFSPDAVALVGCSKACSSLRAAEAGKQIHGEVVRRGWLQMDHTIRSVLVDMYAKCGLLGFAADIFDRLSVHNGVSWTALITGLEACISIGALDKSHELHSDVMKQGIERNVYVDKLLARDVFWNFLIAGFVEQNLHEEGLASFERMQMEMVQPNVGTFRCALKSCASLEAVERGRDGHSRLVESELEQDLYVGNNLVELYSKVGGLLPEAPEALDSLPTRNVFAWTALISGYTQQGQGEEALTRFEQMQEEGLYPNSVTFACTLKASGCVGVAGKGKQIHDGISRQGLLGKDIVLGNALEGVYAESRFLTKARKVLKELPVRDVISWTTLTAGYAHYAREL